jgi:hypothetical protein
LSLLALFAAFGIPAIGFVNEAKLERAGEEAAFEAFLHEHGYAVAQARLGRDYLRHREETARFYEALSRRLFGREIPQVLLLHANALNAEHLGGLAEMLRDRGYRFVPLAEALADPAYGSRDTFIGPRGRSWLQRWAITRGEPPGQEPLAPAWVAGAARASPAAR